VHAVVARSTFPSQNVQKTPGPSTFGSCDVEKVHAVVARSTFPSQNVQNTPGQSTFGSCDVEKVHAVVARSTFPSQCTKHAILGQLLEVEMSKKCTPLWCEAHFPVKMLKAPHAWTTFEGSDVVLRGRRKGCAPCQK